MTILEFEDIPQEVIDNVKQHYINVTFENYGKPVTEKCVSRKSEYTRCIEQNVSREIINPETFVLEMTQGVDVHEIYIMRGEFDKDTADIYYAQLFEELSNETNKDFTGQR